MRQRQGFTLIELLIVIAIIGLLAAVLIPNLMASRNKAHDTAVIGFVKHCMQAVEISRDVVTGDPPSVNGAGCNSAALGDAALQEIPSMEPGSSLITVDVATKQVSVQARSVTGKLISYDGGQMTITP